MSKKVEFVNPDNFSQTNKDQCVSYLTYLFENDGLLFKEKVKTGEIQIQNKESMDIHDEKSNLRYTIMGNCLGPVLYILEIQNIK